MGIRICPDCGGKVALSLDACPHCGYSFAKGKACPECGEGCDEGANACPACGHSFEEAPQQAADGVGWDAVSNEASAYSTPGVFPLIDKASGNVIYGLYPQSVVTNGNIIAELENCEISENGWRFYDGHYYVSCEADAHFYKAPILSNGEPMVDGEYYWFRCDPITWKVLEVKEGRCLLVSTLVLDARHYSEDYHRTSFGAKKDYGYYPNKYSESGIRKWLNEDFYREAFCMNDSYVQETLVSNGPETIGMGRKGNKFACERTLDKVLLLSREEMERTDYFNSFAARSCEASDYAKAHGAHGGFPSLDGGKCCDYWTRSPSGDKFNLAQLVLNMGAVSCGRIGSMAGVRPAITIKIEG